MAFLIGNVQIKKCLHAISLFKAEINCKWNHLLVAAAAVLEEATTALP